MSRGLGRLQTRLLAELEQGSGSARQLSDRTGASYEPVRRALRSLEARGLIVDDGRYLPWDNEIGCRVGAWQRHYALPR